MTENSLQKDDNMLLDVHGLKKYFPITGGIMGKVVSYVKAVDDVNFFVREGETLGLVGESGCGKTTAGRTVLRLYEPTAGDIRFKSRALSSTGKPEWVNIRELDKKELKAVRQDISMIFQDPIGSLNP
ncbi:MAG: ATP-binding cassette domain-containing protein, partial [Anaerolineales bacterium]